MENKEMIPVKEEKNNLIEELLETQNYVSPMVNIYETDNEFILSADMHLQLSLSQLQVAIYFRPLVYPSFLPFAF